ncbi:MULTISPECIES: hypothetical protein [Brevibacillus]|uniref:hypothetical protein n=1 Tax=Brevibacillus TaxID=55080 RepID=UPI00257ED04A|nr:hypothetical protein [Brevibacillus sp.]
MIIQTEKRSGACTTGVPLLFDYLRAGPASKPVTRRLIKRTVTQPITRPGQAYCHAIF